jgi:rod shape determining protein RodA
MILVRQVERSAYLQLIAAAVGMVMLCVIIKLIEDPDKISRFRFPTMIVAVGLLLTSILFGKITKGAANWIYIGSFSFQPSELVKIFFIITFSKHLSLLKDNDMLHSLAGVLSLLIHTAIPVVIIHMQGDDGTVLIFIFMFLIMSFVGGVQLRYFLIMLLLLAAGIPIIWTYFMNEEHKNRFTAIFDIDGNAMKNYGWQQSPGKVSVASGGLRGTGLGNGARVASGIVPEQENDFIFTVAGEELGFIGCLLLITILLALCVKLILIAMQARDYQGRMICIGVFSMIGVQTVINIGMVLGLLPVIGITLPFFSSGGTSLLAVLAGIGLAQSVKYHKDVSDAPEGKLRNNKYKYLNNNSIRY